MNKKLLLPLIATVVVALGVTIFLWNNKHNSNSFESCVAAGYYTNKSYPELCQVPNGQSFEPTTKSPITKDQALALIKACKADGTYSFDSGAGLLLKDGTLQPVKDAQAEVLRQNQNPSCPLNRNIIE